MHPDGEVARAIDDDGVVRQGVPQPRHDFRELHRARRGERLLPFLVGLARVLPPAAPGAPVHGLELRQRRREAARAGRHDRQVRLIDSAKLARIGVDVDELLLRPRRFDQGVAAGRHLAQSRARHQQQIGVLDLLGELRVDAKPYVAHVAGAIVANVILPPERRRDGQPVRLGEVLNPRSRLRIPSTAAAAANEDEWPFRRRQQFPELLHVRRRRMRLDALIALQVRHFGLLAQHVLRQSQNHRAGPSRNGGMKRAAHIFGDARGVINLSGPFGQRCEHLPEVDLLKALAVEEAALCLADEQDHRGRILPCDMDARTRVRGAGPARDHANSRLPG